MRIFATVLVLAAACGGTVGWADAGDSPATRWAKTDLNFDIANNFISNAKCISSLTYLESCVAAVSAANKLIADPVSLLENALNFEETLRAIGTALPKDVPLQLMLADAINAHLQTFDSHAYLAPANEETDSYYGLGMNVRKVAQGFLVTEVFEGSPAEKGKLAFCDIITQSEGMENQKFLGLSVADLAKVMRGPVGTSVMLKVVRNGVERSQKVTRAKVENKSVSASTTSADSSIGFIRIRDFAAGKSCLLVKKAIAVLESSGVKKLVLDLRNNPGGSTREAVCIASLFAGIDEIVGLEPLEVQIPEKDLITIYDSKTEIHWLRGTTFSPTSLPLVILVDRMTTSAAEILAGSLQALKRAWLVGERTFGKGSQQTFNPYPDHPSLIIAATTDRVILPNLMSHHRVGLTPNFYAEITGTYRNLEDLEALSEEGQFPRSPAANNDAWTDPRTEEISMLKKCIQDEGYDQKFLKGLGASTGDYQKAYGAAVLKCVGP